MLAECRDSCKCYTITLENFQKLPPQACRAARMMALAEGASPPSPPRRALDCTEREIMVVRVVLGRTRTSISLISQLMAQGSDACDGWVAGVAFFASVSWQPAGTMIWPLWSSHAQ